MNRRIIKFAAPLFLALLSPFTAKSQTAAFNGWCALGGTQSLTSGLPSSNYTLGVIPNCLVTVYLTGTNTKATIYRDFSNTPLTNPFNASVIGRTGTGQWLFYAQTGQGYDVTMTGGNTPLTYPSPVTLTDLIVGGGGGGGASPGLPAGSYQFNNNGIFGGNSQVLDASAFTGDWGARVTKCLAAITTSSGTCDARSLAGTTQTSANSVTIPANLTLLWGGTVTMASGRNIVAANTSSFIGASVYTASLVGNTAGPLLDGTAGGITFDQFSVTNNDTLDSNATASTLALHDNHVGTVNFYGYAAVVLNIGAGYYGEYENVSVYQFNPSGIAMQVTGANSTHFNHYKTVTTNAIGLAVDNTDGLYFDYADMENSTAEEVLVGGSTPGRVYMGIAGGYVQPTSGTLDFYIGPNYTLGTITTEGVTWFGYSTGCAPVHNCYLALLNFGGGPSNNGAVTLQPGNYNGVGPAELTVLGDEAGLGLVPTTGSPLHIVPCSTAWCVWNSAGGAPTTNPLIMEMPLTTLAPTTSAAGFNLPPGTAPTSPNNGDCWTTTAGLFCQIDGATVGPYGASGGGNLSGTLTPGTYAIATGAHTLGDSVFNTANFYIDSSANVNVGGGLPTATGGTNTAVGVATLSSNTTGGSNTALGAAALVSNTVGNYNAALGESALNSNVSGSQNNAFGNSALYDNTSGAYNTAIGYQSLSTNNTGSHNIGIGDTTATQGAADTNEIVIGSGVTGNGSNTVTLGNSSITGLYIGPLSLSTINGTGALTNDGSGNLSWTPSLTGTLTTNYYPIATGANTLGDGSIYAVPISGLHITPAASGSQIITISASSTVNISGGIQTNVGTTSAATLVLGNTVGLYAAAGPIEIENNLAGDAGSVEFGNGTYVAPIGIHDVEISAPSSVATSYGIILPAAQGTGAFTNDGAGNMSWTPAIIGIDASGTPVTPSAGVINFTASSPIVLTPSGNTININCPSCGASTGGTNVAVNGGSTLGSANINSTSPSADASFLALTPKISGANVIIEAPYATGAAFGVMEAGTGLTATAGVIAPTFGTATNQVAEGGVITAAGPTGGATSIPVITYNAAGQLTAVTTATPTVATVQGGTTNELLYQTAANTTGFISVVDSAVLCTSAGGVPSECTTLPSGLTIPSPTFTGTITTPLSTAGIVTTSGGGVLSSEAQATAAQGGTGISTASSTGVAQVLSGTWSVSTALANGTTATTQSAADNTTKVATDAFVLANSVTNPMTTLGDTVYGGASGVMTRLAGPTAGAGTYFLSDVTIGSSAVATTWTNAATYLASPPAIGGTAPAAGSFTSLKDTGLTNTFLVATNSSGTAIAATAAGVGTVINLAQYGVLVSGGLASAVVEVSPSTSGLPLVSQGAAANPVFAALGPSALASQAANTLLGNGTGSPAAPTAIAMPSCSGAANALNWTSGTGPGCNSAINAAQLSGKSITGSGAGIPTGPVSGTTVNDIVTMATISGQIQDSGVQYGTTGTDVLRLSGGFVPVANLPLATSSVVGAVKPDNVTITVSGGVISAVGGYLGGVQLIMPTTTINANTCTSPATVAITGLVAPSGTTPGSTFSVSYESNPDAVTGWGSSGGLSLKTWPTTNTLNWDVCNTTGSNITPGALNIDIGAFAL